MTTYPYKLKLVNEKIEYVHVKEIQKCCARVHTVGVLYESEEEFGEIHATSFQRVSQCEDIDSLEMNHLNHFQIEEIKTLLSKYNKLFSGKVEIAKV